MRRWCTCTCVCVLAVGIGAGGTPARADITVGSKNFEESRLLAEMFAQLIEAETDVTVHRRLNLAGSAVAFEALRTGGIDVYPEYTGTGLVTLLGEEAHGGAASARNRVRREFQRRWNLWWLSPLGFENAYELAVPRAIADAQGIRTISDLAAVSGDMTAGFGYEFAKRDDGLPGLEAMYGLRFKTVTTLQQNLKYQAAGLGQVDCLDVYTTDGNLALFDLVVLEDDKNFFPPYEAAPLVRGEALEQYPELFPILEQLAGTLDADTMRRLNLRMEPPERAPVEQVAHDALRALGLVGEREVTAVSSRGRTFSGYMWANRAVLGRRTVEHVVLSATALVLGALVAIPLGLLLERWPAGAELTIRFIGVTQTIPSIALLAFMLPLFGEVGWKPAVVALWVYSIFPILRNTYTGLRDAPPDAVEAATGLGMTGGQVLRYVRLPLAAPVIMAGVRTAAVITVGTATLAAFIGAGGLGKEIVSGLQLNDSIVILSGALPAAVLAVVVDAVLGAVERRLTPRGLHART